MAMVGDDEQGPWSIATVQQTDCNQGLIGRFVV